MTADMVMQGLINYIDNEVMDKFPTSGRWVMGTVVGLASTKTTHVIESLKENKIVCALEVVDDRGEIDTDAILTSLRVSAEKYGKIALDVPLVGKLTFSSADVDVLKTYMR